MKLTGKCREDFEKYRMLYYSETENEVKGSGCSIWESLGYSMQYGVYVDFFDSVCINIDVFHNYILDGKNDNIIVLGYYYELNAQPNIHVSQDCEDHKTRPESRAQAIEKANEIYNSKG
jgi:hypothetical protein